MAFNKTVSPKTYSVKFVNNSSKRWDGKVIEVEADWLHRLYAEEAVVPGEELVLPWPGKKGVVKSWNGVIVEKEQKKQLASSSSEGNTKAGSVVIVYPIFIFY